MNLKWFVLVCAWLASSASGKSIQRLTMQRIIAEWMDIDGAGLGMNVPFNNSVQECGIRLSPLRKNILEWHFSFKGVDSSNFESGVYHGKIKLHPEYPEKAPTINMLTPSGRWEVNMDICLSATAHHQETWNPNWNLRTLVMSLRDFMTTQAREVGSVKTEPSLQRMLATESRKWICKECNTMHSRLVENNPQMVDISRHFLFTNDKEKIAHLKTLSFAPTAKKAKTVVNERGKSAAMVPHRPKRVHDVEKSKDVIPVYIKSLFLLVKQIFPFLLIVILVDMFF